jgi:hypothetical protein
MASAGAVTTCADSRAAGAIWADDNETSCIAAAWASAGRIVGAGGFGDCAPVVDVEATVSVGAGPGFSVAATAGVMVGGVSRSLLTAAAVDVEATANADAGDDFAAAAPTGVMLGGVFAP